MPRESVLVFQNVLSEGCPTFTTFFFCFIFLGDEGREDPNTTTVECHLNDVSLTSKICPNIEFWLGSFVILQGIRTSIAKKIRNPTAL